MLYFVAVVLAFGRMYSDWRTDGFFLLKNLLQCAPVWKCFSRVTLKLEWRATSLIWSCCIFRAASFFLLLFLLTASGALPLGGSSPPMHVPLPLFFFFHLRVSPSSSSQPQCLSFMLIYLTPPPPPPLLYVTLFHFWGYLAPDPLQLLSLFSVSAPCCFFFLLFLIIISSRLPDVLIMSRSFNICTMITLEGYA